MRILVLGAGGIGGYFGGRLAQAGVDVTFLVREPRARNLASGGLLIKSPFGDGKLDAKTTTQETLAGAYDLILLSCKAYDLDTAIVAIKPAVGAGTTILPLLNGIAHLDRLDAAFGRERVIGGTAHISVTLGEDGAIHHLNTLHRLTYGQRDTTVDSARFDAFAALFAKASFEAKRSSNIVGELWEKFAFITAASGITCLMRASVGAIMATDEGDRLTRLLFAECRAVAAASGVPVRVQAEQWGSAFLTDRSSDFTASMLRDLESGAKIEADHLQGDMIRRGTACGIPTDLLRVAYCHLQAYQNRRAA